MKDPQWPETSQDLRNYLSDALPYTDGDVARVLGGAITLIDRLAARVETLEGCLRRHGLNDPEAP